MRWSMPNISTLSMAQNDHEENSNHEELNMLECFSRIIFCISRATNIRKFEDFAPASATHYAYYTILQTSPPDP